MGRSTGRSRRPPLLIASVPAVLAVLAFAGCGNLEEPGERPGEPIVAAPQGGPTGPDGPRPEQPRTKKPQPGFHEAAEEICRDAAREMREASRSPVAALDPAGLFVDVLGPFSAELRALGPPRELLPALDRLDSMVAEAKASPQQTFGTSLRSLEALTDDLTAISRGFNRAGLQNCGI